jgi:DNA replication protein DnaC
MTRLLKASGLPDGKTLGNLDEQLLTAKIRRLWPTLLEGHFVERAENLIAIGLPGRGKTHFLAALGRELILRHRMAVLFVPTFKLVQGLLVAKKGLRLEAELHRLDRYPSSSTILATCSKTARRWKCSSRSWPSATSGAAC